MCPSIAGVSGLLGSPHATLRAALLPGRLATTGAAMARRSEPLPPRVLRTFALPSPCCVTSGSNCKSDAPAVSSPRKLLVPFRCRHSDGDIRWKRSRPQSPLSSPREPQTRHHNSWFNPFHMQALRQQHDAVNEQPPRLAGNTRSSWCLAHRMWMGRP